MALDLSYKPFSGVGIVTLYPRNSAGVLSGGYDLGETPAFQVTHEAPFLEMKTSRNTERGTAFRTAQSRAARLSIDLATVNDFIFGLVSTGQWTDVAAPGAPVTNWTAPNNLVVGQVIKLPAANVSSVTVKDSTGSPKTLAAGQYELDPLAATIKLLDITTGGAYVQPFKVDFTEGAVSTLGAFKAPESDYTVVLAGTNAYDNSRGVFTGYKFRFLGDGDVPWITGDQYAGYKLNGELLKDTARAANSAGGQYYSYVKAAA
jgi:hypothetical protein